MTRRETLQALRSHTGCSLIDGHRALEAHGWDIDKATEHLRTLGQAVVVKNPTSTCGSPTCTVEASAARRERGK